MEGEQELRERELALKAREQDDRDQEVTLKRKEQDRSKWNMPLILALVGATITGVANLLVAGYNGFVEHRSNIERSESATIV